MKTSRKPKRATTGRPPRSKRSPRTITPSRTKAPLRTKARTKAQQAAPRKKPAGGERRERRADLGAPVGGFFTRQPPHLRAILESLRTLVEEAAPEATASLKWGMPFYTIGREVVCALAGFKTHVNLILPGAPGTYADPDGLLEGEGKTGRHLKLRALDELPGDAVRAWLRTAAQAAREDAAAQR